MRIDTQKVVGDFTESQCRKADLADPEAVAALKRLTAERKRLP